MPERIPSNFLCLALNMRQEMVEKKHAEEV